MHAAIEHFAATRQRLKALLIDFAKICNGELGADQLLVYEMAA